MKLKDILLESPTDVVARFYIEASAASDKFYNPEDFKYKEKTSAYYKEHFDSWFKEGKVPVFEKPTDLVQPEYTNEPKQGKLQSPGFRGLQYALAAAGLPYNHNLQAYEPNAAGIMSRPEMDAYTGQ